MGGLVKNLVHRSDQVLNFERLAQDRPDSELREPFGPVRSHGRQNDDGDPLEEPIVSQMLEHLPPVHPRHHQIEHHQLRKRGLDDLHRFLAIASLARGEPDPYEDLAEQVPDRRIVVDDQDVVRDRRLPAPVSTLLINQKWSPQKRRGPAG